MSQGSDEVLIATYEQLNEHVRSRESVRMTVMSILLPASLVLATLSFDPNVQAGAARSLPFFGTSALPGGSILVTVLALVYALTGVQVDQIYWRHIHRLEGQLGIKEGQAKIWEELGNQRFHRLRRYIFPIALILVLAAYAILFYRLV